MNLRGAGPNADLFQDYIFEWNRRINFTPLSDKKQLQKVKIDHKGDNAAILLF